MPERIMDAIHDDEAILIKATRIREIYSLPAVDDCPSLFVKVFNTHDLTTRLRSLILGSPALREWRNLHHLLGRDLPVPKPLALGIQSPFGRAPRSYLAVEALEEVDSVEDLLLSKRPLPLSRGILTRRLGLLIRRMHDAGVFHSDLHAANLLVNRSGEPFLVDLHSACIRKRLSRARRIRDLISLSGSFLIHASRADRLRFFKAYADHLESMQDFRQAARSIESAAWERLYWFLQKFDLRCMRPGRKFQPLQVHLLSGMTVQDEETKKLAEGLGPYPEEVLSWGGQQLHKSPQSRVYGLSTGDKSLVIKCYEKPGFGSGLKRSLRGSRGRKAWINYHRLLFRGLKVPKPLFYLEEPPLAPAGRSYVATEAAFDCERLDLFVQKAKPEALRRVAGSLAARIARMHKLFLRNRDLKAQNILLTSEGEPLFIDPDGIDSIKEPALHVIARDLMRLNASFIASNPITLTLRFRFLKTYAAHMGLTSAAIREVWREVLHLTLDKWNTWQRRR
ncbi:MAG: lipopolysaccharide kinase InaA family protein [Planctomycetota bacterium]